MKIVDVRTTVVSIPFKEPESWAFGYVHGISNVIIEIETDTGLVGLGECPHFPTSRVVLEVLNTMCPFVLGRDPFDHAVLLQELNQLHGWHHFPRTGNIATAGIDMALWDLVGQSTGQPLYKLFGGAFRKQIPYYFYIADKELYEMAEDAKRGVSEGFETFYLKLCGDLDHNLQVVGTVRDAIGPHKKLRVDANESWSNTGAAAEIMRKLGEYDIEFFEQPLHYYDHEGAARLRRVTGFSVAANQSAWTEAETLAVIKADAADQVLTDQHQLGSLAAFHRMAWTLAALGIPVMKHVFGDLGITTYAGIHVLASAPNCVKASQTHYSLLADDVIEGGIPKFHKGCLTLPETPGIGVKLDRKRVQKWSEYAKEHGEFSAFDVGKDTKDVGVWNPE